jgi:hypothetical protein
VLCRRGKSYLKFLRNSVFLIVDIPSTSVVQIIVLSIGVYMDSNAQIRTDCALIEVMSLHLPTGIEEIRDETSGRTTYVLPAGTRIKHFRNLCAPRRQVPSFKATAQLNNLLCFDTTWSA